MRQIRLRIQILGLKNVLKHEFHKRQQHESNTKQHWQTICILCCGNRRNTGSICKLEHRQANETYSIQRVPQQRPRTSICTTQPGTHSPPLGRQRQPTDANHGHEVHTNVTRTTQRPGIYEHPAEHPGDTNSNGTSPPV